LTLGKAKQILADFEVYPKIKGKKEDEFLYPVGTILVLPKNRIPISDIISKYKNSVEIFKPPYEGFYTLKVKKEEEAISIANEIYEGGLVVWCHPNFLMPFSKNFIPNDPLFSNQFYLNQSNDIDINATTAWEITQGTTGLSVAVIDDGVEDHVDLRDNTGTTRVLQGFHRPRDIHGNQVDNLCQMLIYL
jgi:serine protease